MNDLVQRLCQGEHRVEVTIRPERSLQALKECIDRGFVHIRFTDTRGGTELGVRLDKQAMDPIHPESLSETGTVRLVGGLTLNYEKVTCVADIDLSTFEGRGKLQPASA